MDVYEIAKQYLGGTIASEETLAQRRIRRVEWRKPKQECTATCEITIPAPPDVAKNCKIECLNATTSEVKVRYEFDLRKGFKVKAVVKVYKGGTLVGEGEWVHETPGWCWPLPTDWCHISEERTIGISGVSYGDKLLVTLEVYKA